jgi:YVTN family beta-propeller protein
MKANIALRSAIVVVSLIASLRPAVAQQFATIDFPGAQATVPQTVNNLGQIVGVYRDSQNILHGFLLQAGIFTTLDYPGSTGTVADAINNSGEIVGYYLDSSGTSHGFTLINGAYSTLDDPQFPQTQLSAVDDSGNVVGGCIDATLIYHGCYYSKGSFTTIDVPGATFTDLAGINFLGSSIVGFYGTSGNVDHAVLYQSGVFTTVDFPGASASVANGINDGGQIAGTYYLNGDYSTPYAYVQSGATYTTDDFPSAIATGSANISDSGEVVGAYTDVSNVQHGYLMSFGPFTYLTNYGLNSVSVYDATTGISMSTVPVGSGPLGMALAPSGLSLYVSNSNADSVSVLSTSSNTVTATVAVGANPEGVAVTPNGSFAYVANSGSASVSVINTVTNTVTTTIPVGTSPIQLAATPDGNYIYVTNQGSNSVSVISTATNTVTATVTVGSQPAGIAITSDGKFAYVSNVDSASVSVIDTSTNTVSTTINVASGPVRVSITPDGTTAYVSNYSGNTVSVINVATNRLIASIPVQSPYGSVVSPDGATVWITNYGLNTVSLVSTSTNTITSTLAVPHGSLSNSVVIGGAPPVTQPIRQPLSPTALNVFNFGPHAQKVQYPPGTNFQGIFMTVTAVELTQADFQARVAGTQFSTAACVVYSGAGGNCLDYQVTCDNGQTQVQCPPSNSQNIVVETSYDTQQSITNPGFLTTPIGQNQWTNIFDSFFLQRIDPTTKGRTNGFSEFVAVDLGAANPQGAGVFAFEAPFKVTHTYKLGKFSKLPVAFQLTAVTNPKIFITDAVAGITVVQIADGNGNPTSNIVLSLNNAFKYRHDQNRYGYWLDISKYPRGTYMVTVFGNAFPAQQSQFSLQ